MALSGGADHDWRSTRNSQGQGRTQAERQSVMKKHIRTTSLLATICMTGLAVASPQDEGRRGVARDQDRDQDQETASDGRFMRLDAIQDAELGVLVTGDGETSFEKLGVVNDIVINAATGSIEHLIISSGGVLGIADTLRQVPLGQVTFNGKEARFETKMTEEVFEAIMAFDKDQFRERQLSARKRVIEASAPTRNDDGEQDEEAKRKAMRAANERMQCLTDDIAGWQVHVMGEDESEVGDIYVDVAGSTLSFVAFDCEHDGDEVTLVVPFTAFDVVPSAEEGDTDCYLQLNQPKSVLASAPKMGDNDDAVLEDPAFREKIRNFYKREQSGLRRR